MSGSQRDHVFEVRQLAGAPAQLDVAVDDDGDAGRVVAAIFEPPQPVDQDGHDFLRSDVSDDPAHSIHGLPSEFTTFCVLLASSTQPSIVALLAGADRERAGGHVLANGRPAADVGACADRHRRDELRVAADEGAVLDDRRVLCLTPS